MSSIITRLTTPELVKIYNAVAKTPVTKFKDRPTAESRVNSLTTGMGMKLVEVFKKVGISEALTKELETVINPPKAPEKPIRKEKTFEAHPMLTIIRELIAESKDETTSSAEVAKKIGALPEKVVVQCDEFAKQNLLHIEDDSDGEDKFYYLHLTDLGKTCDVAAGEPGKGLGKAKKEKAERATGGVKRERTTAGKMDFSGLKVNRLVKDNPRREGSGRWQSFDKAKNGITFEEFIKAGGQKNHMIEMVNDLLIEMI